MTRIPRHRNQRGSSLVESSLTLLLFLGIIFGILEFGRLLWVYNTLPHAARESSRFAALHGADSTAPATATDIRTVAVRNAVGLTPANLTTNVTWTPNAKVGSAVRVELVYRYVPLVPLYPGRNLTLRTASQMIVTF